MRAFAVALLAGLPLAALNADGIPLEARMCAGIPIGSFLHRRVRYPVFGIDVLGRPRVRLAEEDRAEVAFVPHRRRRFFAAQQFEILPKYFHIVIERRFIHYGFRRRLIETRSLDLAVHLRLVGVDLLELGIQRADFSHKCEKLFRRFCRRYRFVPQHLCFFLQTVRDTVPDLRAALHQARAVLSGRLFGISCGHALEPDVFRQRHESAGWLAIA
jgi:hypothetical protein